MKKIRQRHARFDKQLAFRGTTITTSNCRQDYSQDLFCVGYMQTYTNISYYISEDHRVIYVYRVIYYSCFFICFVLDFSIIYYIVLLITLPEPHFEISLKRKFPCIYIGGHQKRACTFNSLSLSLPLYDSCATSQRPSLSDKKCRSIQF